MAELAQLTAQLFGTADGATAVTAVAAAPDGGGGEPTRRAPEKSAAAALPLAANAAAADSGSGVAIAGNVAAAADPQAEVAAASCTRRQLLTRRASSGVDLRGAVGRGLRGGSGGTGLSAMVDALRELVAFPSVSADPAAAHHVVGAANWLRRELEDMGAETKLVCPRRPAEPQPAVAGGGAGGGAGSGAGAGGASVGDGIGAGRSTGFPIVLGRIVVDASRPTIVFYGHYDVVAASGAGWHSPPFQLTVSDGFVRGRGVTDNKGPVIAMLAAVRELLRAKEPPPFNFAFALDGEEEVGSVGFEAAVRNERRWLAGEAGVACVLVCNTYWLSDERPCLVYGLRGVVHLDVRVRGAKRSLHSGVHGGAVYEPTIELASLLGTLVHRGSSEVAVPGFHESVRPLEQAEASLYDGVDFDSAAYARRIGAAVRDVARDGARDGGRATAEAAGGGGGARACEESRRLLMARWRQPCLSINQLSANADSTNFAVIPPEALAHISVRFVPDQSAEEMVRLVSAHLHAHFDSLGTPNSLSVVAVGGGEWWLGDPHSPPYQAAARALERVWGLRPSFIREGGTIPVTSCLERLLGAPAVHLSLGQASDNAHLDNERMSLKALFKGKQTLQLFMHELARLYPGPCAARARRARASFG